MSGKNPMRWDCKEHGCFNWKKRPKIEEFAECLPRNIKFSDIDGIVEINGKALLLEWKGESAGEIPTGQRIMYERLTRNSDNAVLILVGDARDMTITRRCLVWGGSLREWQAGNLDDAKEHIRRWAEWADRSPRPALQLVGGGK